MSFQTSILKRSALCLLLCAVAFPLPAFGQDLAIMTGEWKPFVSRDLENCGFTAEITSQAFLAVGIRPVFQFAPWSRCEAGIKYGKTFAAFPYTKTGTRARFADFSEPIAKSRTVFFYNRKKFKRFDFSELDNLKSLLIGGVRGYYYEPMFKKAGLSVDYSENEDDSFKKLFYGRVDIVPVNELVGWETVNRLFHDQVDMFSTTKKTLDESELTLMASRKYPDTAKLLERFNKGLRTIKVNGVYKKIIVRYNIPQTVGSFTQDNSTQDASSTD